MIERISKYRINSILGYGAMGTVYKATDEAINRTVAIKTIHPHLLLGESGEELLSRFKIEAMAAARCQHHNIVSIYDFGEHENAPYIVMEFVDGQSLESLLKTHSVLTLEQISTVSFIVMLSLLILLFQTTTALKLQILALPKLRTQMQHNWDSL